MKRFIILLIIGLLTAFAFAQSDDDLFGGSDDDLFTDDSIVEVKDVSAKSDLSKGVIFDTGSIKVGGSLSAGITTNTVLYSPEENDLGKNIYASTLKPDLSAMLSVDARPTETLRIYTKFGFAYPFQNKATANGNSIVIADWFKLKELFTDFSLKDTAFFRFGIHTVTWGTGYFFSPVSDMINTSSIDPENPEKQVDGALNLRTQIVFPNSQNCLWFYVIPSTNFTNQTAESYMRETALAGKFDLLIGNWEFGIGGFYKYQNAPKAMLTATGSLRKIGFFGEFVYSYGSASEWARNNNWDDKTSIIQATAGFSYMWKEPQITLAAQYYFNGNDKDPAAYVIGGHNIAALLSFGKLFNNNDFTASIFAIGNFGRKEMTSAEREMLKLSGATDEMLAAVSGTALTSTAMLYYSPIKELKVGLGPSITFKTFEANPTISLKLSATLGGGKF
ncbi:MAG: hypothetical protein SPK18_06460 [Treponema sp.]|nr:hypothetical protein [Treponema sp.]MDY3722899.1 hypothetical protein [Treponema sp.]MDY5758206.1 hypothetical protein [Treponema sp.]MDY5818648.1 hypothetical protein [Treponema sp.]